MQIQSWAWKYNKKYISKTKGRWWARVKSDCFAIRTKEFERQNQTWKRTKQKVIQYEHKRMCLGKQKYVAAKTKETTAINKREPLGEARG